MSWIKKYYPVQWENGMKLNKELFQHQYNAHTYNDILSLKAQVNAQCYGVFVSGEQYEVYVSYDNQQTLHVRIPKLAAVTPGGCLIDIDAGAEQALGLEVTQLQLLIPIGKEDGDYWVVLLAQPFETTGAGFNGSNTMYAKAQYELVIVSQNEINSRQLIPNGFVIGEITLRGNQVTLNEDFLPVVTRVNAHPDIYQWYASLLKVLENIDGRCIQIIQKIVQKNQQNDLSKLVYKLCESVSAVMNIHLSKCSISNGNNHPLELIVTLSSIARSIKNAVDMNIGAGKEELMNYLSEWVNITPGVFEDTLSKVSSMQYHTIDSNRNISAVNYFITTINHLFDTLQKLDFIGKKKDSGLFIKEETNHESNAQSPADQSKPKRRFFGY